jgi:hypothetical protein
MLQKEEVLKISEVRERLSDIGREVFKTRKRYEVELNRMGMFAIVPMEDLKRLQEMDKKREKNIQFIEEVRANFADVSEEELEQEIARNLAIVRGEMREEERQKQ